MTTCRLLLSIKVSTLFEFKLIEPPLTMQTIAQDVRACSFPYDFHAFLRLNFVCPYADANEVTNRS